MNTKLCSDGADLDEDLNLFDEDDWDFLKMDDTSGIAKNYDYFYDVHDSEFMNSETPRWKIIAFTLFVFLLGVSAVISSAMIYRYTIAKNLSTKLDVKNAKTEVDNSALVHVSGETAGSDVVIGINKLFSNYINSLNNTSVSSSLNNYCVSSSNFASLEETYRTSTTYSYDINDCYARALQEYARYIKLSSINDVVLKDGKYYCYVSLTTPDYDNFYEYFIKYSYEMTKYFGVNTLDSISVTKYMLQATSNNDLPVKTSEYLFIVNDTNGNDNYEIADDSQITNICTSSYSSAIDNITKILGGRLVKNQYGSSD